MATLNQQLHNSATHKAGFDPACPECTKRVVEALQLAIVTLAPAVLSAIAGCESHPVGTVTYSKVDPGVVK